MHRAIFSTAYLPSIEYISALLKFSSCEMELWEHFQKQSARNRCHILSANGIQTLVIPVLHEQKNKILTKDTKICYDEPWQRIHWTAMYSAYNKSPFFEFYREEVKKIIFSNQVFLTDLNTELLQWILKILKSKIEIQFTKTFEKNYPEHDYRSLSNVKTSIRPKIKTTPKEYPQVFNYKFGFVSNLSIVDLIFNEGNAANAYLK